MKKFSWIFYGLVLSIQQTWAQVGSDLNGIIPAYEEGGDSNLNSLATRVEMGTVRIQDVLFFIVKLIDLVSGISGTLCVIALLYGGFKYMTSGLSDKKEEAIKTIRYALIGLAVTFSAYLIVNMIFVQFTGQGMMWSTGWTE